MQDDEQETIKSIKARIREAGDILRTRAEVLERVWEGLSKTEREKLGLAGLRREIAAELNDPDQMEFTIDGEPYPIEDVPLEMLKRRGFRLIVAGERLIKRGEAYLAEADRRFKEQRNA